jgi:cytochrome c
MLRSGLTMDSFELNKIAGAVLATGLGVMAVSIVSEAIYAPVEAEKPGYAIAVSDTGGEGGASGGTSGGEQVAAIAERLQTADITKGQASAKKCLACHTLEKGQPNKVGPNLYNVIGSPIIHPNNGFKYSQAFEDKGKEGFTWTFENLDTFLANPRGDIPGTAMSFAGLKKADERADVIAYMHTLSDNPLPLPAPGGDKAAEAPANGGAAAPADTATPAPAAPAGDAAPAK